MVCQRVLLIDTTVENIAKLRLSIAESRKLKLDISIEPHDIDPLPVLRDNGPSVYHLREHVITEVVF